MRYRHHKIIGATLALLGLLGAVSLFFSGYQSFHKNTVPNSEARTAFIVYTDSGFQPPSISVRTGTRITFRNDSSKPFQPVSDIGFVNQRCDDDYRGACSPIPPGESWIARFEGNRTLNYHDALKPSATATIDVVTLPSDMQPTLCDGVPCKI